MQSTENTTPPYSLVEASVNAWSCWSIIEDGCLELTSWHCMSSKLWQAFFPSLPCRKLLIRDGLVPVCLLLPNISLPCKTDGANQPMTSYSLAIADDNYFYLILGALVLLRRRSPGLCPSKCPRPSHECLVQHRCGELEAASLEGLPAQFVSAPESSTSISSDHTTSIL